MDVYIDWIKRGLARSGKTQRGLARAMGVDPARVVEILKGKRRVHLQEIESIALYLALPPPSAILHSAHQTTGAVPVRGRIEAGVWRERAAVSPPDPQGFVPAIMDQRFLVSDQIAYEIGSPAQDNSLAIGDYVICVPWEQALSIPGRRLAVISQTRGELSTLMLGEVYERNGNDFVRLVIPINLGDLPLAKITPIARVIAVHRKVV